MHTSTSNVRAEPGGEPVGTDEGDAVVALQVDRCELDAVGVDAERDVERTRIVEPSLPQLATTAGCVPNGVDDEAMSRRRGCGRSLERDRTVGSRCGDSALVGSDRRELQLEQPSTDVQSPVGPPQPAIEQQVCEGRRVDPEGTADIGARRDVDGAVGRNGQLECRGLDRGCVQLAGMEPPGAAHAIPAGLQDPDDTGAAAGQLDESHATRRRLLRRRFGHRPSVDERADREFEVAQWARRCDGAPVDS